MRKPNEKKTKQLGMSYGTACGRLKKRMLFHLAQQLKLVHCFRCGELIENIDEFSLDHKKPWLDASPYLFWNLDNVAFSHLSCNVSAARHTQVKKTSHGTHSGYSYSGCRCYNCVRAQREYQRAWKDPTYRKTKRLVGS